MEPGKRRREPPEASDEYSEEYYPTQKKARVLDQGGNPRPEPRVNLTLNPPHPTDPSQADPNGPRSGTSEVSTCYSQEVENYDVGPGVEARGVPTAHDLEYWGWAPEVPPFLRSQSGIEGNWVGIKPLGRGGFAVAGLWERRGDDGEMVEQMVIKEESFTNEMWRSQREVRAVRPEAKIMSQLNKKHCHAIPRLFNYKRYPLERKHRLYMEYCPFHDLATLRSRYNRFRRYLPEPFLWETFYHLVEALVAMRHHSDYEIVHCDIKPGNVFLGYRNEDKLPFYPVAKLGDFGVALMTNRDDPKNPAAYRGGGTPGYRAPEQQLKTKREDQLSSSTNVWGIGVVMFELLTFHRYSHYKDDAHKHIRTDKTPEYSETLRNLISACVRPIPTQRIELDRLRERIQSYRDRAHREYTETDDDGRADFNTRNMLYYLGNEINNIPITEELNPTQPPAQSAFPDPDNPILPPRFPDVEEIPPPFPDDEEIKDGPEAVDDFGGEIDDGPIAANDVRQENEDDEQGGRFIHDADADVEERGMDDESVAMDLGTEDEDEAEMPPDAALAPALLPAVSAPVIQAPAPALPPAPVVQAPAPAPVIQAPAPPPAPVVQAQPPAPVVQAPAPAPVIQAPAPPPALPPASVVQAQAPAPAPAPPAPAPVPRILRSGRIFGYSTPVIQAPAPPPAPVVQAPPPAPPPALPPAPVVQPPAPPQPPPAPAPNRVPRILRSGRTFGYY